MGNLLQDGSFASGSPPWQTEGSVVFGSEFGPPHAALLTGTIIPPITGAPTPAVVKQPVVVDSSLLYDVIVTAAPTSGSALLVAEFDANAIATFTGADAPSGLTRLAATWQPPASASVLFGFRVPPIGGWLLDDAYLAPVPEISRMKRGLRLAYLDVFAALKGISTGAGYHHDVNDVKPRKVHPLSGGLTSPPYICAPIEADGVALEQDGGFAIVSLPISVYVFPAVIESEDAEASAAADILDWYDDLMRCFLPLNAGEISTLGSRYIENVTIGSARMYSDPAPDDPAHLMFPVTVSVKVSRDSLGA